MIDEIINKHAERLHQILNSDFGWRDSSKAPFIEYYARTFRDRFHEKVASEFLNYTLTEQALTQSEASILRLAYYFSTYSNKNVGVLSRRKYGLIGNFIGEGHRDEGNLPSDYKMKLQIFWLFVSSHASTLSEDEQSDELFFQNSIKNIEEALKSIYSELEISYAFKTPKSIFFTNAQSPTIDLSFVRGRQRDQLIQLTKEFLDQCSLRKALMGQEFEILGKPGYEDSKRELVEILNKVLLRK